MGGDSTLIDQLLAAHGAADAARLEGVVEELSEIAAESFGADAENLASLVRASGGIAVLVGAIDTGCGLALRQSALSLIGNLLTNVFDPEAHQSLQLFAQAGGLEQLTAALGDDFPINLFAAAALQNVSALDPVDCCAKLREIGASDRLAQLSMDENDQVVTAARRASASSPRARLRTCMRRHAQAAARARAARARVRVARVACGHGTREAALYVRIRRDPRRASHTA